MDQLKDSLWYTIKQRREELKKDDIYSKLKFGSDIKEEENNEESVPARSFLSQNNVDKINLDGRIGNVSKLLNNQNLEDKRILNDEIDIKLSKDPQYFEKLLEDYKLKFSHMKFSQFLDEEIKKILKQGRERKQEQEKSFEFLSKFFIDEEDLRNVDYDVEYKNYQKLVYNERVMSVFKGKEDIFEDPFGMGLEPSLKTYHPEHFNHVIHGEEKDVKKLNIKNQKVTNDNLQSDSRFFNFVDKF